MEIYNNKNDSKDDIIQVGKDYYVKATSSLAANQAWVIKDGDSFAIFDRTGDIQPVGLGEQGLYHEGTRFLSRLELLFGSQRPMLLSSSVKSENILVTIDLTNPDVHQEEEIILHRHAYHVFRAKFLHKGICYERIRIRNFNVRPISIPIHFRFEADFADIFEVRGLQRQRRGEFLPPILGRDRDYVKLSYRGLDGGLRQSVLQFQPRPDSLSETEARWEIRLGPHQETTLYLTVSCLRGEEESWGNPKSYEAAYSESLAFLKKSKARSCSIYTSNEQFNDWVNRSHADLYMMLTEKKTGPYPYAGVPWYCTPFGRDGIISALESLWIDPEIARGVLAFLASTQAQEIIPEREAEPGKILHELRLGEMSATGEIPFGLYYGSVDAPALFVFLGGAYYERTDDYPFLQYIWPSLERALDWMRTYGDKDGDGFLEYLRSSSNGLVHHGWKDSYDAVFHADGTPAQGPIALCEVQGYAYAAWKAASRMARRLGKEDLAQKYSCCADKLQRKFEEAFWCEDIGTYAFALDGEKRPCKVRTSNAGQHLFSGIASPERAKRVARLLLSEEFFTGWGIRTVGSSEKRYNPMSYHSGSVWPHDCALIAYGMSQYGLKEEALQIFNGLFDASIFMPLQRLPELFCGFPRRQDEGPTLYPVACSPQTWSAASVFLLLQACMGLSFNARQNQIFFSHPLLPESIQEIWIKNLRVKESSLDIYLSRHNADVSVNIVRKEGNAKTIVTK